MAKTLTVYLAADLKKFSGGLNSAQSQMNGFSGMLNKVLGPALIGAGVAAGAFATKLAVDGVRSAMEDEAAVAKLGTTLHNLGFDAALTPLEAYIAKMELATGIVDNELRAAFERLVRSTGDVEEAQRALQISVDVSASKGKDLMQVADSIGKAYDGQVTSIQRLGTGISNATILSKDMEAITSELQSLFAGQAQAAAQTYEGQLNRVNVAFENLKETFGAGFLSGLGDTNEATNTLMDTMKGLETAMEDVGESIGTIVEALAGNKGLQNAVVDSADNLGVLATAFSNISTAAADAADSTSEYSANLPGTDEYSGPIGQARRLIDTLRVLNIWFDSTAEEADIASGAVMDFSGGLKNGSITARDMALAAKAAAPAIEAAGDAADDAGDDAQVAAVQFATLADAMAAAAGKSFNWRREVNGSTDDARKQETALQNLIIDRKYDAWLAGQQAASNKNLGGATSSAARDTDTLTAAEKRLVKAYEDQQDTYDKTNKSLMQHKADLEAVTAAAEQYSSVIRSGLQSAIDIGKAYSGQFNKEGEQTGLSLYEGFQQQVDHLEWFGNVLGALKSEGAAPEFIAEIAQQGAGIGGALGEQLLGDSMVKEMSDQWVNVQTKIDELTEGLLPEFMQTGIAAGSDLVTGLAEQLKAEGKTLASLGKKIAKPVGANFKAQLMADVADALRAVEASASAAKAEKVAQAQAEAARLTEQAVSQALGRLISQGDARTGRNLSPVLS